MQAFKYIILLVIIFLGSGCDQPKETVNSDQVSTSDLIRWAEVRRMADDSTSIIVYLQSSEWKTRDLGFGESMEQYHPDVELSGGEYLDITFDGVLERFENGSVSPFEADFSRNYSSSVRYDVIFYRNTGEIITIDSN